MSAWDDETRIRQQQALAAVEELKRTLRERAEIVVARERELGEMRRELARRLAQAGAGVEAAGLPDEREQRLARRERELDAALAAAAAREREAAAELALAQAERDRLEERERAVHDVERELAGLRVRLEQERAALADAAPPAPQPVPEPSFDPEPEAEPESPPAPTPLPPPRETPPDLEPAAIAESSALAGLQQPAEGDTAESAQLRRTRRR